MLSRQNGDHEEAQRCLRERWIFTGPPPGRIRTNPRRHCIIWRRRLKSRAIYDGAAGEYERVLRLKERQVGGNRQEAADAQVRLAGLYVKSGRMGAARELLTQAIGALERKGGPQLAQAFEIFAEVEEHMGNPSGGGAMAGAGAGNQ